VKPTTHWKALALLDMFKEKNTKCKA